MSRGIMCSNPIKYFIVFSLFLIGDFVVKAQQVINYENDSVVLSISSQLEVYEDKNSTLTAIDLINNNVEFEKTGQQIPSYSFTKSTIWSRFGLNNLTNKNCYLEVSPPILNYVALYQVYEDRIDSTFLGSFYTDMNVNTLYSNSYIFKLDNEADYYLLETKSKTRLFIKAQIGSYDAFLKKSGTVDVIQGVYAGLILMILIYNLFLYFTNRENVYLYYLLHILNLILFFLYMSGYGIKFIWNDFPIINAYIGYQFWICIIYSVCN